MRSGGDAFLPRDADGRSTHKFARVYLEMVLDIVRAYPGLPDYRTLRCSEIRFFYNGIRRALHEATKKK